MINIFEIVRDHRENIICTTYENWLKFSSQKDQITPFEVEEAKQLRELEA